MLALGAAAAPIGLTGPGEQVWQLAQVGVGGGGAVGASGAVGAVLGPVLGTVAPAGAPVAAQPAVPGARSAPGGVSGQAGSSASAQGAGLGSNASSSGATYDTADAAGAAPTELVLPLDGEKRAAEETEFQRFVQSATGQRLALYGYQLFDNPRQYAPVLSAPVPGSYVLGPGDELLVQTFGLVDVAERLVIDREGKVLVPRVGPLVLGGMPFAEAERALSAHIGKVYANFTLSLSMGRVRSIEVFVVGQARRPGKHVVSGLSTAINALFETGGPSTNGSLRQVQVRRGGKLVASIDMYRFLAQGDAASDVKLQSGDVLVIPPAGPRAALLGSINAPAIYELLPNERIEQILDISGGLPALAAPQKAQLERLDARRDIPRYVEDFALDAQGLKRPLQAGDVLTVFQISPQIANVVTLEGNVAAPMRYTFAPGMRVADVLSDPRLLIPGSYWQSVNRGGNISSPSRAEVNRDYATIQRLDPVTLRTRLIAFNPARAIALDPLQNLDLQSGDILSVYKPDEAGPEADNSVSIQGEVVGGLRRFAWQPGLTLRDLIPSAQWLVDYFNYWQRPTGQSLRNDINWDYAQLVRRVPKTLQTESLTINLGQQVLATPGVAPLVLQAGDQVQLFTTAQVPVPVDKRFQQVTLKGEVKVPGTYQLQPGENLQQLVQRAGGFTPNAYLYAAAFTRESTRQQQQANLDQLVRRAEADVSSQSATLLQNQSEGSAATTQGQLLQQRREIERLRGLRASGRIALELEPTAVQLPRLRLEDGDTITIPPSPDFVGVVGAVLAETAFVYRSGETVERYLQRAGTTREADLDEVMLLRANGSIEAPSRSGGWFSQGVRGREVFPGDTIFVPEKLDRRTAYTRFMDGAKDWTSLIYQFGLGAAAFKVLRD